ncbi:MAG: tail fiber domain-containing protein [Deltaproteobacteria bacterium]|nr:tail fiber domain-containing protein [Candidatus Tharpella aukensis]
MKRIRFILLLLLVCSWLTTVYAADKLIVKNDNGKTVVTLQDEGRIMLGTDNWQGASWASLYSVNDNGLTGFHFSSYANSNSRGGGGIYTFTRGTPGAPEALKEGDRLGFILFGGYDGNQILNTAGITAKVDGEVSEGRLPTKVLFESGLAGYPRQARLTIASSGKIGIGVDNPGYLIEVLGGAYCDGNDWYPASSRDYKDDIEKLDRETAVKIVNELEPVTYRYKNQKGWRRKRIGFIAEDMPEELAVPGKKALSNTDIIATLALVIKEQQKAIHSLNCRLKELEKRQCRHKDVADCQEVLFVSARGQTADATPVCPRCDLRGGD